MEPDTTAVRMEPGPVDTGHPLRARALRAQLALR
jgi:hypothetical protein